MAALVLILSGCDNTAGDETEEQTGQANIVSFDQGWNQDNELDFYFKSQGSQLIPYYWFLALEQIDNDGLFRDDENIRRFGFIPQTKLANFNPDGLPIGFVKDDTTDSILQSSLSTTRLSTNRGYNEWMGLTCAACHTSEIRYNNQIIRINGGPPLLDMQTFLQNMLSALRTTTSNDIKLTRFAKNVLAQGGYSEGEKARLREEVDAYIEWLYSYTKINYGELHTPYGYGRLDAFGAILNRVSASLIGIEANGSPANAPVSFPFLWNTSQLSWVQWNGSVNNHIGRNIGEVTGVFGHTILNTDNEADRFYSSADIINLDRLEQLMGLLDSPKWGAPLPDIDESKKEKGEKLFAGNCNVCHGIRDQNGDFPMTKAEDNPFGKQFIKITMIPLRVIGTDPLMAMNFVNPELNVDPGVLRPYLPEEIRSMPEVPRGAMLSVVVQNVIKKQLAAFNPPLDQQQMLELTGFHTDDEEPPNLVAYKARPLNGIWATAPYLHNGSVANLHQLLLPDEERDKSFYVGSNEFDTAEVGFNSNKTEYSFLFNTVDNQGNPIPGNSNMGHSGNRHTKTKDQNGSWRDYTEDERYQLIEYLKSL